jgi:cytochrome c oxidase subunit 2
MNFLPQASTFATKSDQIFLYVFILSLVFLVFITALMIYFVVRYSHKRHPKAEQIEGHTLLEVTWTVVPLLLFLGIFYFGWTRYDYSRRAPRDAMVVKVTGRQWTWSFQYPNGKQTDKLYAVLGRPMKLDINSADILHGFYIPAFRLKADAVPGRTNTLWFQPTRLGSYDIQCTVICGVNHSSMLSHVEVIPEKDFKAWYFGAEGTPEPMGIAATTETVPGPAEEHAALALMRPRGCLGCHSIDGKPMVGPTLRGLYGRREEVVTKDGVEWVTMDDEHIRLAILEPSREVVRGYAAQMPTITIGPDELASVVAYIKELR